MPSRQPPDPDAARRVLVRPVARSDRSWLVGQGLDPRKIGEQYHWLETPLQLYIAPARALTAHRHPACVIVLDGRRAGYVGVNPLSGNLEYFLAPWARGGGTGTAALAAFLRDHRPGDRPRRFHIDYRNERSLRTLRRACAALGWTEGGQYDVVAGRHGWEAQVGPG